MNYFKKFILLSLIFLTFDFFFSQIFLKKTDFWKKDLYKGKPWRVKSANYHHDLLPNINEVEYWGFNKQKLITNSLGFRDQDNRKVLKDSEKKRILLIGDSFIEGLGYDYEFTLSGLLQSHYGIDYEILNSAVSSYSPKIYYYKTKYLIDNGYKFDTALAFLDVSDPVDEIHLDFEPNKPIVENTKIQFKKKFYIIIYYLRDNFLTFRFFSILSDKIEILKNYIKDKYKASKFFNKNFFSLSEEELNLFKMLHVKRGNWTRNIKSYENIKSGIKSSEIYLYKLFYLFKQNNIKSYFIVYPWPSQIFFGDKYHEVYWKNFSKKNDINFLSIYPYFSGPDKKKIILKNFIQGDIHWNKIGTSIVFNKIIESNILEN